ncbi:MAG: T9SS type A sorting domain-containing protein [Bacteroidetes bacterium]|nr:T9SS type A sorting domain-containing protein [Bacteroidota bacterium]
MKFITSMVFSLVLSATASGKIIYTDIKPDSVVVQPFGSYFLDLDNDGNTEYGVWLISTGQGITILSIDSNEVLGAAVGANHSPHAFNFSDSIGPNQTIWSDNNNGHMLMSPFGLGVWNGAQDKYLGLRFYKNSKIYYGWARLDVDSLGNVFTVKDYAYEDVDGKGLKAGETMITSNMQISIPPDVFLFEQRGNTLQIRIINPNLPLDWKIILYSIEGRTMRSGTFTSEFYKLDIRNLNSGMYILEFQTREAALRRKLFIN